jgi:hypothetical protein
MNSLKSALSILAKWQATESQIEAILTKNKSTIDERCSYILEINQALHIAFNNSENIYGFMQMQNNNPFFEGRRPLDIIANCKIETMKEATSRIKALT